MKECPEPVKRLRLVHARQGVCVKNATAADGGRRQALSQDETIARQQDNRLVQSETRDSVRAGFDGGTFIKQNSCECIGCKRVEVKTRSVVQSFDIGKESDLRIDALDSCQRVWRHQS